MIWLASCLTGIMEELIHVANEEIPECGLTELLVDRCMARYPQDRLGSFEQVYSELSKIKGNLPPRNIGEHTGRFQIPTHGQRTIIFSEEKEKRDKEQELAEKKERRKRDTRVAKFEDPKPEKEPDPTLRKMLDLAEQGIEVEEEGGHLHRTVQRVLGNNQEEVTTPEQESDAIDLEGNPFAFPSEFSGKTITIESPKNSSSFLRARGKRVSLPVYNSRTWGTKSGSYRKFHKK